MAEPLRHAEYVRDCLPWQKRVDRRMELVALLTALHAEENAPEDIAEALIDAGMVEV
jgi:hypothetical protein